MSGFKRMSDWEFEDPFAAHRRHVAELRDKYLDGTATSQEVDEYWAEILKDNEELELLKTEVNLRAVINENSD